MGYVAAVDIDVDDTRADLMMPRAILNAIGDAAVGWHVEMVPLIELVVS